MNNPGLDEEGVRLESRAYIGLYGTFGVRDFAFTRPFFVLLMRQGADTPYYAAWIGNTDLLVRSEDRENEIMEK